MRGKQAQHPGLHRVIVIEDPDDRRAQAIDDIEHEVAVPIENERTILVGGTRSGRHPQEATA